MSSAPAVVPPQYTFTALDPHNASLVSRPVNPKIAAGWHAVALQLQGQLGPCPMLNAVPNWRPADLHRAAARFLDVPENTPYVLLQRTNATNPSFSASMVITRRGHIALEVEDAVPTIQEEGYEYSLVLHFGHYGGTSPSLLHSMVLAGIDVWGSRRDALTDPWLADQMHSSKPSVRVRRMCAGVPLRLTLEKCAAGTDAIEVKIRWPNGHGQRLIDQRILYSELATIFSLMGWPVDFADVPTTTKEHRNMLERASQAGSQWRVSGRRVVVPLDVPQPDPKLLQTTVTTLWRSAPPPLPSVRSARSQ